MSTYFTVDRGNTVTKLALWRGEILERMALEENFCMPAVMSFLSGADDVAGVAYCSVATCDDVEWLRDISPLFINLDASIPLPLSIGYATPATLGADRIAGAVGAWSLTGGGDILVVDAGTAVTYDVVSGDRYLGGNIAPGLKMRLDSLHRFTRRLPWVEVPVEINCAPIPGITTADAMTRGALFGIVAETAYYRNCLPSGAKVVMTGGDSKLLRSVMPWDDVIVDDMLVSKGLNRILSYNEK